VCATIDIAVVGPFQSDGHGQAAVQWAGTSPGVQSHRNSTVMSHAVVYGGQSSYQVTRGGPDGTGRPPREWTSLYQGTTYGASGYKSHIHAMERPVPIVPASPRPATSKSHSGYTQFLGFYSRTVYWGLQAIAAINWTSG